MTDTRWRRVTNRARYTTYAASEIMKSSLSVPTEVAFKLGGGQSSRAENDRMKRQDTGASRVVMGINLEEHFWLSNTTSSLLDFACLGRLVDEGWYFILQKTGCLANALLRLEYHVFAHGLQLGI